MCFLMRFVEGYPAERICTNTQLQILDEQRDPWRPLFFDKFLPVVTNASSVLEAGLLLNEKIWYLYS